MCSLEQQGAYAKLKSIHASLSHWEGQSCQTQKLHSVISTTLPSSALPTALFTHNSS